MQTPKQMVQALLDRGLSQTEIEVESGVSQPTISRICQGKGVSYPNGKKIESLYERILKKQKSHTRRTTDKQDKKH